MLKPAFLVCKGKLIWNRFCLLTNVILFFFHTPTCIHNTLASYTYKQFQSSFCSTLYFVATNFKISISLGSPDLCMTGDIQLAYTIQAKSESMLVYPFNQSINPSVNIWIKQVENNQVSRAVTDSIGQLVNQSVNQ